MSTSKSKPPEFKSGMTLPAALLQELSDWCWRNRVIFNGDDFRVVQSVAGQVVSASGGNSTSIHSAVATTTITAASSKSTYPITYGTGSVKLDIDGATTATQSSTAISVRNRAPVSFAADDLVWVYFSGGYWYVIQRYCP